MSNVILIEPKPEELEELKLLVEIFKQLHYKDYPNVRVLQWN